MRVEGAAVRDDLLGKIVKVLLEIRWVDAPTPITEESIPGTSPSGPLGGSLKVFGCQDDLSI